MDDDLSDDDDSVIINKEMAQEIIEQIRHISKISKKQVYMQFLGNRMNREFAKTIVNYHHPDDMSAIEMSIKNNTIRISIKENKIDNVDGLMDLQTQAIYLDDPFVLDELESQLDCFSIICLLGCGHMLGLNFLLE